MTLNRYYAAIMLFFTVDATAFAGGPIDYLLFYNVTRKTVFEAERLDGEVKAARAELKIRQDFMAMAKKLLKVNAISQEEYEWRGLDLTVAEHELEQQQELVALTHTMTEINEERSRHAAGSNIDLRAFFDLNVRRWNHECRLFEIEAEKEHSIYRVEHKIHQRWLNLRGENSIAQSDLMMRENKAQDALVRMRAAQKNIIECQNHRPTWEEISSI